MFLASNGEVVYSATDVAHVGECEYGFLRELDRVLKKEPKAREDGDALGSLTADLGDSFERRFLQELVDKYGVHDPSSGGGVLQFDKGYADSASHALYSSRTTDALRANPDVIYQAPFFDGELLGYADFIHREEDGRWRVADTKLAKTARVSALLQTTAYALQLDKMGFAVSEDVEIHLGSDQSERFPLADIVPLFRQQRDRVRRLIQERTAAGKDTAWGDDRYSVCGSCDHCVDAVGAHEDLLLIARLTRTQRRKLRAAGIATVTDLVATGVAPQGLSAATFQTLQRQGRLQLQQMNDPGDQIVHEVFGEGEILRLPLPSEGDIFFDYEGDPLFSEGRSYASLEYLWGVLEAPTRSDPANFRYWWAADRGAERVAFDQFMEYVRARREKYPDMHIYHYAPYEVTALKRLSAANGHHQLLLDELLANQVFVDLYATVRRSVCVSQPAYSIKNLEPLYRDLERDGDVQKGTDSVARFHEFCSLVADGSQGALADAESIKANLLEYNRIDCESTLGLRNWLLSLVADTDRPDVEDPEPTEAELTEPSETQQRRAELGDLAASLLGLATPADGAGRTKEQQCWAMLAAAVLYHDREELPVWWEYFRVLATPPDELGDLRDVFVPTSFEDVTEFDVRRTKSGTRDNRAAPSRTLTAIGPSADGSAVERAKDLKGLYRLPAPFDGGAPSSPYYQPGLGTATATSPFEVTDGGSRTVTLRESLSKTTSENDFYDGVPYAFVENPPTPNDAPTRAVERFVSEALALQALPSCAVVDMLLRTPPRFSDGGGISDAADVVAAAVASMTRLSNSYLAIQGPPGTGKSTKGAAIIAELVNTHGLTVGVVAQSHAVIEGLMQKVHAAGVDPIRMAKFRRDATPDEIPWLLTKPGEAEQRFASAADSGGAVFGSTMWAFARGAVEVDVLVIDEAGQFSVADTIAVAGAAKNLLLLGDPQQLPGVSQNTHDARVDESCLGWLMDGEQRLPAQFGYFLSTTYRMHSAVCEHVSSLSYAGQLTSTASASARRIEDVEPGVAVIDVEHTGNSVASPEEADVVVAKVRSLIGSTWHNPDDLSCPRKLTATDFVVVAPYNAQRALIQARLAAAGLGEVPVGTVDKFQGSEAPISILSMTASSKDDISRGTEFLFNRNRINVAISRAQYLSVIVKSTTLTSFVPSSVPRALELGAFLGVTT